MKQDGLFDNTERTEGKETIWSNNYEKKVSLF